ncbi:NADPH oxidase 5-like [Saccostrea cucullata]|uniref:NADPH oxidase 5-like n=1 Tax=Saccostrea cuccullata TaxID=36930 RepID=UPI002ED575BC
MADKEQLVKKSKDENDDSQDIKIVINDGHGGTELEEVPGMSGEGKPNVSCSQDEKKWLDCVEERFTKKVDEHGRIQFDDFQDVMGVRESFFADRFFSLFDTDKKGSIEISVLMDGLRNLTNGSPVQKLKFVFDVYDIDGSGEIERDELKTILTTCMEESSLYFGEEHLNDLTDAMFEAAGKTGSDSITFQDLRKALEKHPSMTETLTLSATQWFGSATPAKKTEKSWRHKFTWKYFRNNLRKIMFVIIFILINIAITVYTVLEVLEKASDDIALTIFRLAAGIFGMLLNFNCMLVLILVLRKCHTLIRSTPLAAILPLDQHITFHKMVGAVIGVCAIFHSAGAIGTAYIKSEMPTSNNTIVTILFTTKIPMGLIPGSTYITGWALLAVLTVMIIFSLPFVRKSGHFEVFYWTHMLYIPFWILLIIHAPTFWYYFIMPGVLFVIEKIIGSKLFKRVHYGRTFITEVCLLPSGVCHLVITRPENFQFQPGDYIFIQIPDIAHFEWHPFTISSAPEMKGHIWIHVRSLGHWTKRLYDYFSALDPIKEKPDPNVMKRRTLAISQARASWWPNKRQSQYRPKDKEELKAEKRMAQVMKKVQVRCYIDGPYGTATREIFETEHAVLIGAGIGVTPMASILQSVMYRYKESKRTCPKCHHSFYGVIPESAMNLKKVNFIWINRDQKSFEWFVGLLNKIEKEQIDVAFEKGKEMEKVIDIQLYLTAAKTKSDIRGAGLQMALSIIHRRDKKDLITGLSTRTQAGRPNWNEIFGKISEERKGNVKVFFCGPPQLGGIVKKKCMTFGFKFRKENF